jgi:hypothetical protein
MIDICVYITIVSRLLSGYRKLLFQEKVFLAIKSGREVVVKIDGGAAG